MSAFRNEPVDLRYLSDQDKQDFQKGGGYGEQVSSYKRARAQKGQLAYEAKRPIRTRSKTPGTGGQSAGIAIQQERYRRIGEQNAADKSNRPQKDANIYDIYQ